MLSLIKRSARIVDRALDKDDVRVAITLLTKLGVLAANNVPKGFPPISGEDITNETEMKNGGVGSAGKVQGR